MFIFQMGSLQKDGSSELQISVNGMNTTLVGWKWNKLSDIIYSGRRLYQYQDNFILIMLWFITSISYITSLQGNKEVFSLLKCLSVFAVWKLNRNQLRLKVVFIVLIYGTTTVVDCRRKPFNSLNSLTFVCWKWEKMWEKWKNWYYFKI